MPVLSRSERLECLSYTMSCPSNFIRPVGVSNSQYGLKEGAGKKKGLPGSGARQRRRQKALKARDGLEQFFIEEDSNLDRIELLARRAIVGRMEFTSGSKEELLEWVNKQWTPLLGLPPG